MRLARQSLPLKLWKLPWWVKSWITVFMTVTHDCVHNEIYILIILAKMPQQNTKILTVLLLFLCLKYRKSGFPSNSTGTASNAKHTNTLCTIIWRQWDDMYALVMTENYSTIPKRWKNQSHLSWIKWWVVWILSKHEHVNEVDKDAGSAVWILRSKRDPFKHQHEDKVPKKTEHEH